MASAAATDAAGHDRVGLGAVEVLKEGTRVWYCGQAVDVGPGERLVVAFESDIWPKDSFPFSRVRRPPRRKPEEVAAFAPDVGDEVEIRVDASEHAPAGWATATVRRIKHDFYFVAKAGAMGPDASEAIVEKDKLRTPSSSTALVQSAMQQDEYKLPAGLGAWVSSSDGFGCLNHIQEQANLTLIQVHKSIVKMYGESKALLRASKLLDVHVKHQVKIQDFQDKREKGLKALETKRNRIEGTGYKHHTEISLDRSYVPRIIGRGGDRIKEVQDKYDVVIRILDAEPNEGDRTVRIFGHSAESIERARAEVEFVEEALDIEPEMYQWLVGKGGKTIQGFKDSCGLMYATLDREKGQLRTCGPRHAVKEALAMFETHLMYFPVFNQMDEEMGQLIDQLEEYGDYNARWEWTWYRDEGYETSGKGRRDGKGGGKGQGKGGRQQMADANQAWEYPRGGARDWDNGGRNGRWRAWGEDEEDEEDEEEYEPPQRRRGAEKGKGGAKGDQQRGGKAGKNGKSKGGGKAWVAQDDDDDDEEDEEDYEPQPRRGAEKGKGGDKGGARGDHEDGAKAKDGKAGKGGKGKGRGKRGRDDVDDDDDDEDAGEDEAPAAGGRRAAGKASGRGKDAAASEGENVPKAAKPGGTGPSGRRMGKKGMRS